MFIDNNRTNNQLQLEQFRALLEAQKMNNNSLTSNGNPRQVFNDVPENNRPRLSSGLISENSFAPTLSQYTGGIDIKPYIQDNELAWKEHEFELGRLADLYRNIPTLSPDAKRARELLTQYNIKPEWIKDKNAIDKVRSASNVFMQDLNSNNTELGAIYNNYKTRQQFKTNLDEMLQKGLIKPNDYQAALNRFDKEYEAKGGAGQGGEKGFNYYNYRLPANYIDPTQKVNAIINGWKADQVASGYEVFDPKSINSPYIIKNKRTGEVSEIPYEQVHQHIKNMLDTDKEYQAYYKQQADFDTFGNDPNQIKSNILNTAQQRYEQISMMYKNINDKLQNTKSPKAKEMLEAELQKIRQQIEGAENTIATLNSYDPTNEADIQKLNNIMQDRQYQDYINKHANMGADKIAHRTISNFVGNDIQTNDGYFKLLDLAGKAEEEEKNNLINTNNTVLVNTEASQLLPNDIQIKGNDLEIKDSNNPKGENNQMQLDYGKSLKSGLGELLGVKTGNAKSVKEQTMRKEQEIKKIDDLANKMGLPANYTLEQKYKAIKEFEAGNKNRTLVKFEPTSGVAETHTKIAIQGGDFDSREFKFANQTFNNFNDFSKWIVDNKSNEDVKAIIPSEILDNATVGDVKNYFAKNAKVTGVIGGMGREKSGVGGSYVVGLGGNQLFMSGDNQMQKALAPIGELQKRMFNPNLVDDNNPIKLSTGNYVNVKYINGKPYVAEVEKGDEGWETKMVNGKPIYLPLEVLGQLELKNYQKSSFNNATFEGTKKSEDEIKQ